MATIPEMPEPRPVPVGTLLIKDLAAIATLNKDLGDIKDGALFVKDNVIEWVGSTSSIPEEYQSADKVLSLPGRVVMPGMVNTHHHMFQTITRCVAQESQLFGWLTTLYPAWMHLTGEDVHTATKLAMAELMLSGCTTSSDHMYVYPNDVTLDHTIRAAREIGMRFHPTRGIMSKGQSKGGLPPDGLVEEEDAAYQDCIRLIDTYHDNTRYSMCRMSLAPCSPFVVSNDIMKRCAELARQHPGVRLHTHLAENDEDITYMDNAFQQRPLEYIKEVGWDQGDCWFAHCVKLDDAEMALFADRGIGIAHCPCSNLRLASGICPVKTLLKKGVNVGLGVDGSASNDAGHMLAEARLAMLLQRAQGDPGALNVHGTLDIAIKGGARNLGRDDIGEVAPGFAADFVAWNVGDSLYCAGGTHEPVAALLLCHHGNVDLSVINGEVVIEEGKFTTIDLKELVREHNERSRNICSFLGPTPKESYTGKEAPGTV